MVVDYANGRRVDLSGYDVIQIYSYLDFRDDFLEFVTTRGLTALVELKRIEEAIVPPEEHPRNQVVALLPNPQTYTRYILEKDRLYNWNKHPTKQNCKYYKTERIISTTIS